MFCLLGACAVHSWRVGAWAPLKLAPRQHLYLYELQVVSEKRLASAAAEAQAAQRAEQLELQAEINSLAARLAAETRQRQELETEVGFLD